MGKLICRKCYNKQDGILDDIKLKCKRCGSKEIEGYFKVIKLYHRCQSCDKYFKISNIVAERLVKHHSKPSCPYCDSKVTNPTLKKMYKRFSGQLQKIHETKEQTLLDLIE